MSSSPSFEGALTGLLLDLDESNKWPQRGPRRATPSIRLLRRLVSGWYGKGRRRLSHQLTSFPTCASIKTCQASRTVNLTSRPFSPGTPVARHGGLLSQLVVCQCITCRSSKSYAATIWSGLRRTHETKKFNHDITQYFHCLVIHTSDLWRLSHFAAPASVHQHPLSTLRQNRLEREHFTVLP